MNSVIHLLAPELLDVTSAQRKLKTCPTASRESYRAIMSFVPSLHRYFMEVREQGGSHGAELVKELWFRIWSTVEAEKQLDMKTTMNALIKTPDLNDRPITLVMAPFASFEEKLTICIRTLDDLIKSA